MATEWTDELKAQVVEKYQALNPTPANTMEMVDKVAKELNVTTNGARGILSRAKVYIKKDTAKAATATGTETKEKKESKAESIERLKGVLTGLEVKLDDALIDRMTGKAAAYFADAFTVLNGEPTQD